jgi:hypothetical protein
MNLDFASYITPTPKKKIMKARATTIVTALAATLASTQLASAAVITWGSATNISTGVGNSSDVSTNGTLVEAYSGRISGSPSGNNTVNGVLFTSTMNLLPMDSTVNNDFSTSTNGGDTAYDRILSSADFGGGTSTTIVIGDGDGNTNVTGPGLLEVGQLYEIQVWFVDQRTDNETRAMRYGSSSSDPLVTLQGQFVIGTFTADATTQTLYMETNGFAQNHLNAYQIRMIPEPSSALLGGLGLLALLRRRR